MKRSSIAGLGLFAVAAAVEAALIPGLLLGAAAVIVPKALISGQRARRMRPKIRVPAILPGKAAGVARALPAVPLRGGTPKPFEVKKAVFKTITFRMVATSFDFAANMVVIGDITTAAGLSAFGLFGAPVFYFCHEFFWHRVAPPGTTIDVGALTGSGVALGTGRGLMINRPLAKTITYEIVTVTADFGVNFAATRDVATAAGLTAFAVVISPFIYFGHEKVWDSFGAADAGNKRQRVLSPLPVKQTALSFSAAA